MTISFDLDDTLIPSRKEDFETEERNLLQQMFSVEYLRKGTAGLVQSLRKEGHKVGIYTTSYRPVWKIKWALFTYGISVDFVINEQINRRELRKRSIDSSKYPPAFHIDMHIDDLRGVGMEGERFGFNTVIVKTNDVGWTETVEQRILLNC